MSGTIRELYLTLAGHEPAKEEIQKLMSAAHILGINEKDPMLILLATLEVYNGMYSKAPSQIAATVKEAEHNARANADAAIQKATAELIPTITATVKEAIQKTAINTKIAQANLLVLAACLAVSLVFLIGFLTGSTVLASLENMPKSELLKMVVGQGWTAMGLIFSIGFFAHVFFERAQHWLLQTAACVAMLSSAGALVYKFIV
jgi:hypothetical protein